MSSFQPTLQLTFPNGFSIRAREEQRDGEPHVLVAWWRPEGRTAAMEFWVPTKEGHAVFSMLAAYCEELSVQPRVPQSVQTP